MERRISLYVSRRNPFTWFACLFLLASAALRIVFECINDVPCESFWTQMALPVTGTILYILIVLIAGKEMFYKTAIAVFFIDLYFAFEVSQYHFGFMVNMLYWIILVGIFVLYTKITSGRNRGLLWLFLANAAPLAALIYLNRTDLMSGNWAGLMPFLVDALMCLGLMVIVFAIRMHPAGEYHPTWGDRNDGRRVRTLDPLSQITAYFQVERNTCSNLFEFNCEITQIDRYIRQKRKEGYTDFGVLHVLLAAYVRGIAKYPQINRFISGQKVFSRGNDIQY